MILQIVRSDFREFGIWLHNWLVYRRQSFKMGLAIRLADMKQKAWNKQYHVMLLELSDGEKLVSVNNEDINRLRRKKWLPKKATMLELKKSIFYSTPLNRNNKSKPEERKAARDKYIRYSKKFMR